MILDRFEVVAFIILYLLLLFIYEKRENKLWAERILLLPVIAIVLMISLAGFNKDYYSKDDYEVNYVNENSLYLKDGRIIPTSSLYKIEFTDRESKYIESRIYSNDRNIIGMISIDFLDWKQEPTKILYLNNNDIKLGGRK